LNAKPTRARPRVVTTIGVAKRSSLIAIGLLTAVTDLFQRPSNSSSSSTPAPRMHSHPSDESACGYTSPHHASRAEDEAVNSTWKFRWMALPVALASLLGAQTAVADVVSDWNVIAADMTVAAKPATSHPPTGRSPWCRPPFTRPSTPSPSAIDPIA
jgi:hypothetical protein